MRIVGRRDHDALDIIARGERVEIRHDGRLRIRGGRALRLPGRDRGEPRAAAVRDDGRMERRACKTETHQTNLER